MLTMTKPRDQSTATRKWFCRRCFGIIGVVRGTTVTIEHGGRKITASLPCSQECDRCRTLNIQDVDTRESS